MYVDNFLYVCVDCVCVYTHIYVPYCNLQACREVGFFYVKGHGISEGLLEDLATHAATVRV
jgi:hypothetical protein